MSKESKESREEKRRLEDTLKSLEEVREEIGQISELAAEENLLVADFLTTLIRVMRFLPQKLPVSTSVLPEEWGEVSQASLDFAGQLLVLYPDKKMESINLREQRHRELLVRVAYDVVPTLKRLITSYRQKMEARFKLMSSVTKELRRTVKTLSIDDSKQSIS
jgi:hypothetical protein